MLTLVRRHGATQSSRAIPEGARMIEFCRLGSPLGVFNFQDTDRESREPGNLPRRGPKEDLGLPRLTAAVVHLAQQRKVYASTGIELSQRAFSALKLR